VIFIATEQPLPPKHIAEDFYIDGTHIMISDDHCKDKTLEEVDGILREVTIYALKAFRANPHAVEWR
jgi:hypothetical protein